MVSRLAAAEPKSPVQLKEQRKITGQTGGWRGSKKNKQYVCWVQNTHPQLPVLVVAVPSYEKDTVQEVRNRSLEINAGATSGGVNIGNMTDNTFARYATLHLHKTIVARVGKWRLSVKSDPIVHVYLLFPKDVEHNLYYLSESTELNVKTCNFIVEESDFFEGLPVVEVTFNDGMVTIKTPPT